MPLTSDQEVAPRAQKSYLISEIRKKKPNIFPPKAIDQDQQQNKSFARLNFVDREMVRNASRLAERLNRPDQQIQEDLEKF